MDINWKEKLTSRKFWSALIGFVTALLIALKIEQITIEQVAGIITAGGVLVAYILGESYVDGKRAGNESFDSRKPAKLTSETDTTKEVGFKC